MERSYASTKQGMVPTEKVCSNHQQNTDAFHDVEGSIPSLYASRRSHLSFFFSSLSQL